MSSIPRQPLVYIGLALTLALTRPVEGAITFDGSSSGQVTNGTSVSYSHTVSSSGTLLVVGVLVGSSSDLLNTPTYNGVAMTLVNKIRAGEAPWIYQYALTAPPTGTHTLAATTTSAVNFSVVSATYNGTDTSQPDNSTTRWDASGASSTTTTLTPNSDYSWTVLVGAVGWPPIGAGTGSTLRATTGDYGLGGGNRLGIFDSNGPIHPAAAMSMTITAGGATEFGTVMASYAPTSSDPLPMIYSDSLTYLGGFRVPASGCGSDDFWSGGSQIAFNPAGNGGSGSLYVGSRAFNVAEITVPNPMSSATLTNLNTATCLQNFAEPTEGRKVQGNTGSGSEHWAEPGGMAVVDGQLWINNVVDYDDSASQTLYTMSRPLTLPPSSTGQVKGLYGLSSQSGFVSSMASRSIAPISSDWTTAMGGNLFLSKFNTSIITSASWGPNAILTSSATMIGAEQTPYAPAATPLFYTSSNNPAGACGTVGPAVTNNVNQCSNDGFPGATRGSTYSYFSQAHKDGSLVQPKGTSSLLVFQVAGATRGLAYGGYGYGYGCGCSDPGTMPGQSTCGGAGSCPPDGYYYDPETDDKGPHGYPYVYQIAAYDMNDLVAVKNGTLSPWNPLPYTFWEITFPISPTAGQKTRLSNASYDSVNNRIYIAQTGCCDVDGLGTPKPIIHVFQVTP